MLSKSSTFYRCRKRLGKEIFYRPQDGAVIIGLCINLTAEGFPFLPHRLVVIKCHNLLKLFYSKGVAAVLEGLF